MTQSVTASLEFIVPGSGGQKPTFLSAALSEEEVFDFDIEERPVRIEDMRAWSHRPSLDKEGFELLRAPSAVSDLTDDALIRTRYMAEVEDLVRTALDAERVVAFDATRRSDAPEGASNPDGARRPASRIHVDYTEQSGPQRARDVLGAEAFDAARARGQAVVQVNAWRPLTPVLRSPLALGDASSIGPAALVATDQVFPNRVGEIYLLAHEAGQRFAYAPRMEPSEVLLIKGWDSREDGRARLTPHSAFALPNESAAPPRHSIEVRTFAILSLS